MQTDKPNCVLFPTCFRRHEAIDIFDCIPSFLSSPDGIVVVAMPYWEKQSMYRHRIVILGRLKSVKFGGDGLVSFR